MPVIARRLAVAGQGYVGLPLAMRAVDAGYDVVGIDVNGDRVKALEAGESYVEDIDAAQVRQALATGRYRPSTETQAYADFDIAVITTPTPLKEGAPDLSYIEQAARDIADFLRRGTTVVLESTTYPGTTEELVLPILEQGSDLVAGADFFLGYSPERVDPGNAVWSLANTPKLVSGVDPASTTAVRDFYATLVEQVVVVPTTATAELAKLMENTFRHVNIALVNEMAIFAAELGISVWDALDAADTKPYGYLRFNPGPGVGGHCLPIDPSYLSWRVRRRLGRSFRFVELANDVNDHMPNYVVERLMLGLNHRGRALKGSRVLLLGLAYKRNTSDGRESPAVRVVQLLLDLGAEVRAVDPYVVESHVDARAIRVELSKTECQAADAVVLITDHDCFDLDMVAMSAPYVLDTRSAMTPGTAERL